MRGVNPSLMAIVPAAALIGAPQPRHRGARQDSGTHRHVVGVTRLSIFPSIIGAVLVQLIVTMKQPRVTVIAVVVAAIVLFVLVPAVPAPAKPATG